MKSDARYKYRHGIGKYKWINIPSENNEDDDGDEDEENVNNENVNNENTENENDEAPTSSTTNSTTNSSTNNIRRIKRDESYRRVSVTIRHLLSTRRKVYNDYDDESNTIKDPNVY
jgi:hypothetical protein